MSERKLTRRRRVEPAEDAGKHVIDSKATMEALRSARVPSRFIRPEATLDAFAWGVKMRKWLAGPLAECAARGKGAVISGKPEEGATACAMLVRALVLGHADAVFYTLGELLSGTEPRVARYVVVAGFYDDDFQRSQGKPMDARESFRLSWALQRLASDGAAIVAHIHPSLASARQWWHGAMLDALFDYNENFRLNQ